MGEQGKRGCRNSKQHSNMTKTEGCVAVCCSVLQCVAVCCSVLQCVAVYCNVLHCVPVCCSVLQCVASRLYLVSSLKNVDSTINLLCDSMVAPSLIFYTIFANSGVSSHHPSPFWPSTFDGHQRVPSATHCTIL